MGRTVWVDEEEHSMGWIALRVLNLIASKSITLPNDVKSITVDDEIVNDIYFMTLCTPEEIVHFFQTLDQHETPFSNDQDYADHMRAQMEHQEEEMSNQIGEGHEEEEAF